MEPIWQLGITYKDVEASGVIMPVIEWTAKFVRPAHYDDLLTVRTILRQWPVDHRVEFQQEVYDEQGKLLTTGKLCVFSQSRHHGKDGNAGRHGKKAEALLRYCQAGLNAPT